MPVTYVLRVNDENGVPRDLPLEDGVLGTLGYLHVVLYDQGVAVEDIPNVPPVDPPVGQFPGADENGVQVLIPFVPQQVTGGAVIELVSWVTTFVDFSWRYSVGQFGDTIVVEVQLVQRNGRTPLDVSGASVRQIIFRRPDKTALVKDAVNSNTGADGKIRYQFQPGELDYAGTWEAQGRVILANGAEYHGRVQTFAVLHNLPTS